MPGAPCGSPRRWAERIAKPAEGALVWLRFAGFFIARERHPSSRDGVYIRYAGGFVATWTVPVYTQRTANLCWEACARMTWEWRFRAWVDTPPKRVRI